MGCSNGCCLGVSLSHSGWAMVASRSTVTSNVSSLLTHRECTDLMPIQGRFPLAFQLVPGLIIAAGIWFLQESPRWLIEKDRHEEARLVLEKMHGNGSNQEFLDLEYREIRDTIVAEKSLQIPAWSALLKKPSSRRRLLLGCGVQAFGQLSGINVGFLCFYLPCLS